ncbi:hypothetical protein [Anaeromicropila populeti]|uniref:Uncharacterized protein n=1 Tax=Anaeromicropila populeti TaxID=37658 RepID=A0A1I6IB32_9FIRM|nr:hypothetical protein [Anaeromicropila populeti]SFR63590.1 hypothetical protein SAMN05661086_00603 [Anaeromicropila populeti]
MCNFGEVDEIKEKNTMIFLTLVTIVVLIGGILFFEVVFRLDQIRQERAISKMEKILVPDEIEENRVLEDDVNQNKQTVKKDIKWALLTEDDFFAPLVTDYSVTEAVRIGADFLENFYDVSFEDDMFYMTYLYNSGLVNSENFWVGTAVNEEIGRVNRFSVNAATGEVCTFIQMKENNGDYLLKIKVSEEYRALLGIRNAYVHRIEQLLKKISNEYECNLEDWSNTLDEKLKGSLSEEDLYEIDILIGSVERRGKRKFNKIEEQVQALQEELKDDMEILLNKEVEKFQRSGGMEHYIEKSRECIAWLYNEDVEKLNVTLYVAGEIGGYEVVVTKTELPNGKSIWIAVDKTAYEIRSIQIYDKDNTLNYYLK